MTQTNFTDNVFIDGSQDIKQLRVQGHTTQTNALQTWEDSAGNISAQVTGDGRFIVGDDVTPDSLIEVHRLETSTTKPKRGFHSQGQISGTLTSLVQWLVGELELRGSSAINALHTALRIRASNLNTGTPGASAELRGADIEVINDASAGAAALTKATGLKAAVTNASGKTITDAAGVEISINNSGTLTNAYGLRIKQVQGTNRWGVYVDDAAATNWLAGDLLVGGAATASVLNVTKTGAAANAIVNGDAGQSRQLLFRTGNVNRWTVFSDNVAESGSDAGSNFNIARFSDAGVYQGASFSIQRSTGNVFINSNLNVTKAGAVSVAISGDAGQPRQVILLTGGVTRWAMFADGVAEGGSNAGSDFGIGRFNDAGTFQDTSFAITRSTGNVSIANNLLIGSTPPGTSGNHVLVISNGTVPTSPPANAVQLYAKDLTSSSELYVLDEAGNEKLLSSHQPEFFDVIGRPTPFIHRECNLFTGKKVEMDFFGALQALEKLTNQQFIYVGELPAERRLDWDSNEQLKVEQRQHEIEAWQHRKAVYDTWQSLPEAEREALTGVADPGPQPEPYAVKGKPAWMDAIKTD